MKVWRQGDVIIAESEIPKTAKEIKHNGVLAYGEVTGHKHQLVGGQIKYFRDEAQEEKLFFEVRSRFVDLNHGTMPSVNSDGHFPHQLPAGNYAFWRQREADWINEVNRNVSD